MFRKAGTNKSQTVLTLCRIVAVVVLHDFTVVTSLFKIVWIASLYLHHFNRMVIYFDCWLFVDCYFMAHYGDKCVRTLSPFRYKHLVTFTPPMFIDSNLMRFYMKISEEYIALFLR